MGLFVLTATAQSTNPAMAAATRLAAQTEWTPSSSTSGVRNELIACVSATSIWGRKRREGETKRATGEAGESWSVSRER